MSSETSVRVLPIRVEGVLKVRCEITEVSSFVSFLIFFFLKFLRLRSVSCLVRRGFEGFNYKGPSMISTPGRFSPLFRSLSFCTPDLLSPRLCPYHFSFEGL